MFYVITETCTQVDDSPFETRADAESWVRDNGQSGVRYHVLDEAGMTEMKAGQ